MSLKHVILIALSRNPASGYDIVKEFDQSLKHFWNASHQQIYRDLKVLDADGLVTKTTVAQDARPNKYIYRLTSAGRDELEQWLGQSVPVRINNELLVKLLAAESFGVEGALRLLAEQRSIHAARLAAYRRIEREHFAQLALDSMPLEVKLRHAALRRGLLGEADWLNWIVETEGMLKRHRSAVVPQGTDNG